MVDVRSDLFLCVDIYREPLIFGRSLLWYNDNTCFIMKNVQIKGMNVELYDSIEDLPIMRFHKYNKMLLVDAGVGSDLSDFDRHIEKVIRYLNSPTPNMATVELENMRQNIYFIQSEVSPRHLAFAVLVKSINGKPRNDLSDDGLQQTMSLFKDVANSEITAHLEAVKKKIDDELRLYFPRLFDDATLKEYYDKLKQRTIVVLRTIIDGRATEADAKEIDDITAELITYFNPQTFTGSESVEIRHDRQFENMCLILSQNLHVDPKKFTVLEYYNAFEYIKEQAKKANKQKKAK